MDADLRERPRRLNSWKEIAQFLGKDVRTVIRWEKERGLPVRRTSEAPGRPTVYADTDELYRWLLGHRAEPGPRPVGRPTLASAEPVPVPRTPGRQLVVVIACFLLLVIAVSIYHFVNSRAGSAPDYVRNDYPAKLPMSVVTADFNGDGIPDIAFSNTAANDISVLIGDGTGSFRTRLKFPTGDGPERLAVADFNRDGFPDIAVTHKISGDVRVYLNDGHAGFTESFRWNADGRSRWVTAGDLNHDGIPDLAAACSSAKKLAILLGRGDGTFDRVRLYDTDGEPASAAIADFNLDGTPDIAITDYQIGGGTTLSLYTGIGDGSFRGRQPYPTGMGPIALAVADLNGDNHLDVVTANYHDSISILFGNSNGFSPPINVAMGDADGFVAISDFDSDRKPDILFVGEHSDTAYILYGDGTGKFSRSRQWATGRYPDSIAVADLNHDNKPDFVVANVFGNSISVFLAR